MHVVDVNSGPKMMKKNRTMPHWPSTWRQQKKLPVSWDCATLGVDCHRFYRYEKPEHKTSCTMHWKPTCSMTVPNIPYCRSANLDLCRLHAKGEACCTSKPGTMSHLQWYRKSAASILVIDAIERDLAFIMQNMSKPKLTLTVHPSSGLTCKGGCMPSNANGTLNILPGSLSTKTMPSTALQYVSGMPTGIRLFWINSQPY